MPEYEVEVYELHTSKVRVFAKNRADAISKVLEGGGETCISSSEYIEPIAFKHYSDLEQENPGILGELKEAGLDVDGGDETFVRSIEEA